MLKINNLNILDRLIIMQVAVTDNGLKVKAYPEGRAICPNCKSVVIAKCGDLNIWHWAHENISNCDTWTYEPITEWHLSWQKYFKEEQREVYIKRGSDYHIADILTDSGLVIEIQNSPISVSDIILRESFYTKMIWIINSKGFKHNLILKEYPYDVYNEVWFRWVKQYPQGSDKAFAIIIPLDDFYEQVLPAVKSCNYKMAFDKERDTEFWYNKNTQFQQPLEKDILNAFSSYLLDTKLGYALDENKNYSTNFKWLHLRKTWSTASKPIFIDLNNNFLFYIKTLHENGNGFGKIISKQTFLKKYRINDRLS